MPDCYERFKILSDNKARIIIPKENKKKFLEAINVEEPKTEKIMFEDILVEYV